MQKEKTPEPQEAKNKKVKSKKAKEAKNKKVKSKKAKEAKNKKVKDGFGDVTLHQIQEACLDHFLNDCEGCKVRVAHGCLAFLALAGNGGKILSPVDWRLLRHDAGGATIMRNPYEWDGKFLTAEVGEVGGDQHIPDQHAPGDFEKEFAKE